MAHDIFSVKHNLHTEIEKIFSFFLIMIIDWKIYFLIALPFLQIEKFLNYKIMSQSKIIFGSTVNFYSEW